VIERVGVIGLGLIGGSIARDLAAAGVAVSGWDRDATVVEQALEQRIIRDVIDPANPDVPVVVLAVPTRAALEFLGRMAHASYRPRLITDTGSTKREVCREADRLGLGSCFVGAHPLAGDHRSGWAASRTGLFQDARVYLCTTPESSRDAVSCACELWQMLRARPEQHAAEAHDAMLAWTSHLAQFVSSAFGESLASAGYTRELLGPGGQSVARLAESSSGLWAGIGMENADHLIPALEQMQTSLAAMRRALEARDTTALIAQLTAARRWASTEAAADQQAVIAPA